MLGFCWNELNKGDNIGVCVSGGVDSMSLASLLISQSERRGYKLSIVHFEHGIRGEASLSDARFVEEFAQKQGLPFILGSGDCLNYSKQKHVSVEQAARDLRRAFFLELIAEGKVDKLVTAHHLDDECETILMRIFRGTGINGLTGIPSDGKILRPMLNITHKQVIAWANKRAVPYVEDSTNSDNQYTRNYIRNVLMPQIECRFGGYEKSLQRLKLAAVEQTSLLDSLALPYTTTADGVYLSVQQLQQAHVAVAKRSIQLALLSIDANVDFEAIHFDSILKLLSMPTSSEISLAKGVIALKEYDKLLLYRPDVCQDFCTAFRLGELQKNGKRIVVRPFIEGDKIRFDLDKIPDNAVIRTRQNGDSFTKFGGITCLLSDYFTNKKLAKRLRSSIALIAVDNKILAIADTEISETIRVDKNSSNIYTLTMEDL